MKKIYQSGNRFFHRTVTRILGGAAKKLDTSEMWGRVFDLRNKQLVKLDGFSLFVMPDDYIGASIIGAQTYEPHVTAVIRRILQEGDVFLDLGANIGYFSMLASSIVKENGKVIAFEPNPQNLQLIFESKIVNGFPNLKVCPFAVSDREEILRFTTVGSNGGVVTEHSADQKHYLLVQSVVIDESIDRERRIDLIKMDIEAHEPAALRGMEKLLGRLKPKLITEFHPWAMRLNNIEPPEEFLSKLGALHYGISVILPNGNLEKMESPSDVMNYWTQLGSDTAHIDLYAEPF